MRVKLIRTKSDKQGTQGVMLGIHNEVICATQELPWLDNSPNISCIPEGVYQLVPYSSAKYQNVYQVLDVPNRTKILIHIGNFVEDTMGCILVGKDHTGNNNARQMVGNSSQAMNVVRRYFPAKMVTEIEVTNAYG